MWYCFVWRFSFAILIYNCLPTALLSPPHSNLIWSEAPAEVVLWRKSHLSFRSHSKEWTSSPYEQKNAVYNFQISLFVPEQELLSRDIQVFIICKLATVWRHVPNQILIKYDEKRYLSQFEWEMFDSLQGDSTKCAPQYPRNSFVTMATYRVPDLPNIKGFSGHVWRSIFIFANGASYAWSSKHINKLAQVCGLV